MATARTVRSEWQRRMTMPGWVLLPLRMFLGLTFVYAGFQKLADRNFLDPSSPASIQAQLHADVTTSPVGGLLGGASHVALALGLVISLAELAVGLGTVLGLWSKVAAAGGALLSLGFLLTVSWHSHPYYYGADIVFLVAWLPLILVGDGGVLSLATRLREQERRAMGLPAVASVGVEFAAVQTLCGAFEAGRCRRRGGQPCAPGPCPVLRSVAPPRTAIASLDRRAFLATARAAAIVAGGAAAAGVLVGTAGRILSPSSTSTAGALTPTLAVRPGPSRPPSTPPAATSTPATSATAAPPAESTTTVNIRPPGTAIGTAADVPKGGTATFQDPASGDPSFVVAAADGSFRGFSGVCTHAGCTVAPSGSEFVCPCHGARFSMVDGSATRGPAESPLASIAIAVGSDGQLYANP